MNHLRGFPPGIQFPDKRLCLFLLFRQSLPGKSVDFIAGPTAGKIAADDTMAIGAGVAHQYFSTIVDLWNAPGSKYISKAQFE